MRKLHCNSPKTSKVSSSSNAVQENISSPTSPSSGQQVAVPSEEELISDEGSSIRNGRFPYEDLNRVHDDQLERLNQGKLMFCYD